MATVGRTQHDVEQLYDRLYERYVRPLEVEQYGKYIAVAEDGRSVGGQTRFEAARDAAANLSDGAAILRAAASIERAEAREVIFELVYGIAVRDTIAEPMIASENASKSES